MDGRPNRWNKAVFSYSLDFKSVLKSSVFVTDSVDGRPNRRNKAAFSNSSDLKSVFEKLCFHDGLMWIMMD